MGSLSERFPRYSRLLYLYPVSYRRQYGEQMLQTLADMLDDPARSHAGIWSRTITEFPFSVTKQQLSFTKVAMQHSPGYIKRNAIVGGILLLPFVLALCANGLDKIINHHTLYTSWIWQMPQLAVWVLWLPTAAAVLALVSLTIFTLQSRRGTRIRVLQRLADVRHNWPLLAITLAGLFIVAVVLFHDSVHCITGNPLRELQHVSQTWQCIQQR